MPLKKVSVDEDNLYVSNYFHQIVIPLADVEQIKQLRGFNVQPVIVRLRSSCRFGDSIKFVPQPALHWWWNEHPIVSELRETVSLQEKTPEVIHGAG
jgi:hypothetical protein